MMFIELEKRTSLTRDTHIQCRRDSSDVLLLVRGVVFVCQRHRLVHANVTVEAVDALQAVAFIRTAMHTPFELIIIEQSRQ